MKIACLCFTHAGEKLAHRLRDKFNGQVDCYNRSDYKHSLKAIFETVDGIVFFSATGIAVRISAPFLKDKRYDPAIVVVDDLGQFAISLISGHVGGANRLAKTVAELLGCQPVITTASDSRGFEAVDLFAVENGYEIDDWDAVKRITAAMVEGKKIRLAVDDGCPQAVIRYEQLVNKNADGAIIISCRQQVESSIPFCLLRPKILHVGVGYRKGKTGPQIKQAIADVFRTHNLSLDSIAALSTIQIKKDDPGIEDAGREMDCPVSYFSQEEIQGVQHQFSESQWVSQSVGVTSVCEPCAWLSGGPIIVNKTVIDGITIAVGRE